MLGPNTGLGHNSMIFMIESQVHYVTRCLDLIDARGPLAVSGQAQRKFNADLQRRLAGSVWNAGGCVSWYLDANGVNRAIWPGSTVRYWWRTKRLPARDFAPVPAGANGAPEPADGAPEPDVASSLTPG